MESLRISLYYIYLSLYIYIYIYVPSFLGISPSSAKAWPGVRVPRSQTLAREARNTACKVYIYIYIFLSASVAILAQAILAQAIEGQARASSWMNSAMFKCALALLLQVAIAASAPIAGRDGLFRAVRTWLADPLEAAASGPPR